MEKCSMCSNKYPEETVRKMVQVMDKKAYAQNICPVCYQLAVNNPNYYHVTGDFSHRKCEYGAEWTRVFEAAERYAIEPEIIGKALEKKK